MCALAGRQKTDFLEPYRVDEVKTVRHHVRDVEYLTSGIKLDILWHAADGQVAYDRERPQVDFDQLSGKFAGGNQERVVRGEVDVVDAGTVDR